MKRKKIVLYKEVRYFIKTKKPHEVSVGRGHQYSLGCSGNPGVVKCFTAIATDIELETYRRESQQAHFDKPIRFRYSWIPIGKKGKQKRITTYIPNRHQRKHGIGPEGFIQTAQK